jgi:DNA-binding PadR family transcriptional regulator
MREDNLHDAHSRGHERGHEAWHHLRHGRGRWPGRHGHSEEWPEFGRWGGAGFWGRGSHGEPGGRKDRLERGLLRYIILDVLRDGPKHGYDIIKQLEERTRGQYAPSPGTLYPTLQYLDDLGLVRADQEGDRKTYQLTNEGRAELEGHAEHVEHFWSRFADHTPDNVSRHELKFLHDALHDVIRTVRGGVHSVMHGGDPDTLRHVRMVLEKCQNEVREIIARGASAQSSGQEAYTHQTTQTDEPRES